MSIICIHIYIYFDIKIHRSQMHAGRIISHLQSFENKDPSAKLANYFCVLSDAYILRWQFGMHFHMLFQVSRLRKRLSTMRTCIWFVPCVHSTVSLQTIQSTERAGTLVTAVGFFSCMNSHMFF